ncbi:TraR/DksA family transcriptional regulator [Actinobacillus porcinus]|uniref:TraR/DksA family transcriptional regulator n=1 Tax=Actinobacillus porcinus TaxID=51048 RepID=UPI002A908692|nr:TraR/DksA family transcriptional regulator [Actinobacillus porcinus]MDY5420539.1 TraR/DksA family transcriptional regulator [Actinobacillus porcinus]
MSDVVDIAQAQNDVLLEMQLAPRLETKLSDDEIEIIALKGRDCVDCGLPIPIQRLRAVPLAIRCIQCQEDWEYMK